MSFALRVFELSVHVGGPDSPAQNEILTRLLADWPRSRDRSDHGVGVVRRVFKRDPLWCNASAAQRLAATWCTPSEP